MRVHFLTRTAFDKLLKQTQQGIKEAPNQRTRDALARELSILLKASEAFAAQYLKDEPAYVEAVPRTRWKDEST